MTKLINIVSLACVLMSCFFLLKINNIDVMQYVFDFRDCNTAKSVKKQLKAMSESLIDAEKTGDLKLAQLVTDGALKVVDEFNALPEKSKNKVNSTELRYCLIASTNLLGGAIEVSKGGYWSEKERFYNAINMCH